MGNDTQHVVQQRKPGGQPDNRNAVRTGKHTAKVRGVRRQAAAARRQVRAVIRLAEALAGREPA